MDPAPGRLLVAMPSLVDPNFARSIVLLLDQGDEGAVGVVLNRPLEVEVDHVLDAWGALVERPSVLFGGGPVQTEVALAVARVAAGQEPMGWRQVAGELGLLDLDAPVELLEQSLRSLRIFAGYAGWGVGQLEAEIAEGSWLVVPADAGDPFLADPGRLWGQVLRRQGGQIAMLATQPEDPALN